MSTTTLIVISIIIIAFFIWLGYKTILWDKGDNFSKTSFFILIGICGSILGLSFLFYTRSENGTQIWDFGSIIIAIIPILLFFWNLKRVFSTNKFLTSLLILFYHFILIALSPLLILLVLWLIMKGKELISSIFKK